MLQQLRMKAAYDLAHIPNMFILHFLEEGFKEVFILIKNSRGSRKLYVDNNKFVNKATRAEELIRIALELLDEHEMDIVSKTMGTYSFHGVNEKIVSSGYTLSFDEIKDIVTDMSNSAFEN